MACWDTHRPQHHCKTDSYRNNFRDVPSSAWYYDNVAAVYEYGLMNGTESDEFSPNDQVSMAQTVTLAARLRKLYLTGDGTFASSSHCCRSTWTMP